MKTIRSVAILILIVSIVLCSCKGENVKPDTEAVITGDSGLNDTQAVIISSEYISFSDVEPAEITDELEETLWSYKTLTEKQSYYYRIMLSMVQNLVEGFVHLGGYNQDFSSDVAVAFHALLNDFPEYYWMPSSYYISSREGKTSIAFKRSSYEDHYGYTKAQIRRQHEEFYEVIEEIVEKASNENDTFEKARILHDELCKRANYMSEIKADSKHSAYGALINGESTCEGYARAFQLLCNKAGINNVLVSGTSKGVGHLWNMIETEEGWYHIDPTWNDLRKDSLYTYFCLTEKQILVDHDIDQNFSAAEKHSISLGHTYNFELPKSATKLNDYFTKNNLIFNHNDVDQMAKEVVRRYKNGDWQAQFCFSSEEENELFNENYKMLIVEVQKEINKLLSGMKIKLTTISFTGETCVFYYSKAK